MKKVVIIGSGGAGKSTFARRLGEVTGIEVIHLDSLFWGPNWRPTPKDEWSRIVEDLTARDEWIMDGNFGGTREMRVRASDTVIFLDTSRWVCLYRVAKRVVKYHGRTRPDMADGCNERLDLKFNTWVWNFRRGSRPRILEMLECLPEKRTVILRSANEAETFLRSTGRGGQYESHKR